MTLQLALSQIQQPSWWHENDPPEIKYQRHGKVSGSVKQAAVLNAIRAGGRINCEAVVKATGYTIQSIRYTTDRLIKDGKIRRIDASSNRVYWELA